MPIAADKQPESLEPPCGTLAGFIGNPRKVSTFGSRNRGLRGLKWNAKDDVCRMVNPCDATTVGSHSA